MLPAAHEEVVTEEDGHDEDGEHALDARTGARTLVVREGEVAPVGAVPRGEGPADAVDDGGDLAQGLGEIVALNDELGEEQVTLESSLRSLPVNRKVRPTSRNHRRRACTKHSTAPFAMYKSSP